MLAGCAGYPVWQRCGEQCCLALRRGETEDPLDVWREAAVQHLVTFIKDEEAQMLERQAALAQVIECAAGRANHDLGGWQRSLFGAERSATVQQGQAKPHDAGKLADDVADLDGQLASRHQYQGLNAMSGRITQLKQWQAEGERLARARAGLAHHVAAIQQERNDVSLDWRGGDDAPCAERLDEARLNVQLGEGFRPGCICPSGRRRYLCPSGSRRRHKCALTPCRP